ncbi:hypothetical protein BD311DRAFT_781185 [Dichomitus squalens]|nr:hypothetical protein BD311DRAFT_781185 [Dichomitus squalens]
MSRSKQRVDSSCARRASRTRKTMRCPSDALNSYEVWFRDESPAQSVAVGGSLRGAGKLFSAEGLDDSPSLRTYVTHTGTLIQCRPRLRCRAFSQPAPART